jgi:hypothetical protein
MSSRFVVMIAVALLLLVRLPSLVQPMGADQSLYAYVGERIRAGGLPYRDAWDQKPPAIHFLYAGLRTLLPWPAAVPAADLVAAAAVAWLLYRVGAAVGPTGSGAAAALVFLLLSNPALTRLGGIRLRSQCETFIAVAVTAALLLLVRDRKGPSTPAALFAGFLFGLAFTFKYNAAVFAIAGVLTLWLAKRLSFSGVAKLSVGFCLPPLVMLLGFAAAGTLRPLFDATVLYNLAYSAETYTGEMNPALYLLTFPFDRARADGLWMLGGAGCILLSIGAGAQRERLIPVVWVAAACASIAVNGSRSLPQYFIQAAPALALAASWGGVTAWSWMKDGIGARARLLAIPLAAAVIVATWRAGDNPFPKLVEQTVFDARHALGTIDRRDYLARYDDDRKYSALAGVALGEYLQAHSQPADRVYVFGFTCAAYVEANRASASRFFWSRPVIAGFNEGRPGYGTEGLLSDLTFNRPAVVALQQKDWAPDVADSAAFFMSTPRLAGWLQAYYVKGQGPEGFDVWLRRTATP